MHVRVTGLTKRYGSVTALENVSLEIPEGRTALLGPNGAGKSTLLKILLGLTHRTQGKLEVFGMDPAHDPLAVRTRVGYMPEDDSHLPEMTAVELCTYGAELAGLPPTEATERAHAACGYVGLEDKRYLPVESYSAGLKQRAKLAAAIVHDPDLLFLDEPTNGLDPHARDEMLALIADLRTRRGCDVVLSTHLLGDVERVCDNVIVMAGGKTLAQAPLADLLGANDGRYVVRIKGSREPFLATLAKNGCTAAPDEDAPTSLVVTAPVSVGAEPDLDVVWRSALEANVQIRHLAPRRTTLDEAFLRLLG